MHKMALECNTYSSEVFVGGLVGASVEKVINTRCYIEGNIYKTCSVSLSLIYTLSF